MFTVERKRIIHLPAERILAVLADVEHLERIMPRAERVEVLAQSENRARIAISLRLGKLGAWRVEGEARLADDGVRFVAVQPMQIDARWLVVPRGESAEVTARVVSELPAQFAKFARFIPQRLIEERVGMELESALTALESAAMEQKAAGA